MQHKIEKSRGAAKPRKLIRQEVHRDANQTVSHTNLRSAMKHNLEPHPVALKAGAIAQRNAG
jgi:hypothetical protein